MSSPQNSALSPIPTGDAWPPWHTSKLLRLRSRETWVLHWAFDGAAAANSARFFARSGLLPPSPLFDTSAKPNGIDRVQRRRAYCLLDIQHKQEWLSQSQVILKLLNNGIAFTSRHLELPAVHDSYRASHVLYDSLFLHYRRGHAHARSVRTHHRRDEIVRDRK